MKFRGPPAQLRPLIAKAHLAAKELGLDADTRRAVQAEVTGHESCAQMSVPELETLLRHYREKGWKAKPGKGAKAAKLADSDQLAKIRALWLTLRDLGELRDSSEEALRRWCEHMTRSMDARGDWVHPTRRGPGIGALQWLTPGQASKLIEEIKKWSGRVRAKRAAPALAEAETRDCWTRAELAALAARHGAFVEDVEFGLPPETGWQFDPERGVWHR